MFACWESVLQRVRQYVSYQFKIPPESIEFTTLPNSNRSIAYTTTMPSTGGSSSIIPPPLRQESLWNQPISIWAEFECVAQLSGGILLINNHHQDNTTTPTTLTPQSSGGDHQQQDEKIDAAPIDDNDDDPDDEALSPTATSSAPAETLPSRRPRRKTIPRILHRQIWEKCNPNGFDGICWCCGEHLEFAKMECGHDIPRARGGTDELENLYPICTSCNRSCNDDILHEYKAKWYPSPTKQRRRKRKCGS